MSKVIRSVKNVTKGYSGVQVKVREATSNDPWGPTGTQMSAIAQLTFNSPTEFYEIVDMLDKRLNDKGKNWRHVLKALKVLDYCLHEGSELVVTWARENIYIIKTLREFIYIDEEGKDVGQNIRVAAKELTSLLIDEERLRVERTDRKSWKSRVGGLDEYAPPEDRQRPQQQQQRRREPRRQREDEDDTEYKLAIEASKYQEEEDRKRRAGRQPEDDDDLAKAIKLSKEEEDRRRRELEEGNATSLFDDTPPAQPAQPQYTGFNQGYQQGSGVDFFGNPIDQSQLQAQPTGYMNSAYTGFQAQPTGYQNAYNTGYNQPQYTGYDQSQFQQQLQPQQTSFNPYAQAQQPQAIESPAQAGSNNPWATNQGQGLSALQPTPTGSNNPFAQQQQPMQTAYSRPQPFKAATTSTLSPLPEQKTLSTFQQPSFTSTPQQPQKQVSEHEARLNALLAGGDGMDTFGNTGNLRIPAQHTAPGTFVNSAGAGLNRLHADATGNNPFLKQQYTGMPNITYGGQASQQVPSATGFAGQSNPFGARLPQQQQSQGGGDLIQF